MKESSWSVISVSPKEKCRKNDCLKVKTEGESCP
jgi:hypothetical protein